MLSRRFTLRTEDGAWTISSDLGDRPPCSFGSRQDAVRYYNQHLRRDDTWLVMLPADERDGGALRRAAREFRDSNEPSREKRTVS